MSTISVNRPFTGQKRTYTGSSIHYVPIPNKSGSPGRLVVMKFIWETTHDNGTTDCPVQTIAWIEVKGYTPPLRTRIAVLPRDRHLSLNALFEDLKAELVAELSVYEAMGV